MEYHFTVMDKFKCRLLQTLARLWCRLPTVLGNHEQIPSTFSEEFQITSAAELIHCMFKSVM